jgi:TatA/E family protein of Tat protein translocase
MFDGIGKTEIIIIAVVLLIIFGPKKLPEFAKGLSEAVKEVLGAFRGESEGGKKESKSK